MSQTYHLILNGPSEAYYNIATNILSDASKAYGV